MIRPSDKYLLSHLEISKSHSSHEWWGKGSVRGEIGQFIEGELRKIPKDKARTRPEVAGGEWKTGAVEQGRWGIVGKGEIVYFIYIKSREIQGREERIQREPVRGQSLFLARL